MTKNVYYFGKIKTDGNKTMKEILGGKGANLAEMSNLGIPVPPGFTLSTEICDYFNKYNQHYPENLKKEVEDNLHFLEKEINMKFGDAHKPILLSVRSGAAVSMPGMMDTILNLGLNDESVKGFAETTENARFVWDAYRRLIQMFGNVVHQIDSELFEDVLTRIKNIKKVTLDIDLNADDLKLVVEQYKEIYKEEMGEEFPQNPYDQLWSAIDSVFNSWSNARAIKYRELNNITGLLGTAVNVQTMVFGNMGEDCATGVAFTRDPLPVKTDSLENFSLMLRVKMLLQVFELLRKLLKKIQYNGQKIMISLQMKELKSILLLKN